MMQLRHYVLSGGDDPAKIVTACGWKPKNQRPLDQQIAAGVAAFKSAQTRRLFDVNCPECRAAIRSGEVGHVHG